VAAKDDGSEYDLGLYFLPALPPLNLTLVSQWVSATLELGHKEFMSRQKDKTTRRQKDKTTRRQKDNRTNIQKEKKNIEL